MFDATRENEEILPEDGADLNGVLATKLVGDETRYDSTDERTTGHSSGDTTLNIRRDIGAEVIDVSIRADNGGHRRNVETEEGTSKHGDGPVRLSACKSPEIYQKIDIRDEVDVGNDEHVCDDFLAGSLVRRVYCRGVGAARKAYVSLMEEEDGERGGDAVESASVE